LSGKSEIVASLAQLLLASVREALKEPSGSSGMLTTIVLCGTDSAQLCLNYCLSNAVERGRDYARLELQAARCKFCILRGACRSGSLLLLSAASELFFAQNISLKPFYNCWQLCYVISYMHKIQYILHFFLVENISDEFIE